MKKPRSLPFVVDKRDADGVTLLMEAARHGEHERMLKCLAEGSDINAVDNAGYNALMHALQEKQDVTPIFLIDRGIRLDHQAKNGNTALMEACAAGEIPEMIERLLQKKVPLDVQNKKGSTALMYACLLGDGWAACKLVDAGADFEKLRDADGRNALDMARQCLRGDDGEKFLARVELRREAAAEAARQAEKERKRQIQEAVHDAIILNRDIKPLRPVVFRLKPR